jgi:hypothetical protein
MRKHVLYFPLVAVLLLACFSEVSGQQPAAKPNSFPLEFKTKWNSICLRFQGQDFYVSESPVEDTCNCLPQGLQSRGNAGLLISFYRNTGSRVSYSVDLGFSSGRVGTKDVPTLKALKENFTSFRGDLYYHIGPDKQPFSPYLHTGLHAQIGTFYASLPTGAGIRFLARNTPLMLTGEVNYGWGLTNQLRNNLIFGIGAYWRFNAKPSSAAPATAPMIPGVSADACLDSDFDGVPDGADKCPRLAGSPLNAGCPVCDTDGDGVTDEKDKCPTIPGPIQHYGCPVPDTVYITKEVPVASVAPAVIAPEVKFPSSSNVLDADNNKVLTEAAQVIRNNPGGSYVVYGYSGLSKIEKQRSAEQVAAVVNYLVEKEGISPERITVRSGLQGGTPNTVKVRAAAEGEVQASHTAPTFKKLTN